MVSLDYPPSILQVVLVFVYGQLFIIWTIIKNNRLIYSLSRGLAPSGSLFFAKVSITFSCTLPKSAYSQNFLLTRLDFCGNLSQQFNITYLLRVPTRLLKEPEQVFDFLIAT